jgi:hemoglobin
MALRAGAERGLGAGRAAAEQDAIGWFHVWEGNIISVDELDVYGLVGEEGFARLIGAFYRQVPGDPILGPMYPADDLAGAEQRLRDFLVGRFGGPQRYTEQRGHPRLRARHMPFAVNAAARERWLQLMTNALDEAKFPPEADAMLREFFGAVSEMLINRPG